MSRIGCQFLAVAMVLVGCAGPPADDGTRLSARLVSPTEITLVWHGSEVDVAGWVVEFATEPGGPYTILEFLPPGGNRFTHPDLMPRTPFYYRVRPYHGPASAEVDVALPDGPPGDQDDHEWAVPRVLPGGSGVPASIRDGSGAGAPTDLTATVKHANGIWFTWVDRAGDEDGYLIEATPRGRPDSRVAAVVDPDVNSFGLITMPHEKQATYRIRAFYYGRQSNVVHQTTGE